MLTYALRRIMLAIPTLLFISLVIFLLLELSPGDPLGDVPLTVPPEVKEKMREALGLGQAWYIRYVLWLKQFFWIEPLHWVDQLLDTELGCAVGPAAVGIRPHASDGAAGSQDQHMRHAASPPRAQGLDPARLRGGDAR